MAQQSFDPSHTQDRDFVSYVSSLPSAARPYLEYLLDWDNDVDRDLRQLAHHMLGWDRELSIHLRLSEVDIHDIKDQYFMNPKLQRREALRLWKDHHMQLATYGNLLQAFVDAGHTRCAEELCQLLRDKYDSSLTGGMITATKKRLQVINAEKETKEDKRLLQSKYHFENALKHGKVLVEIITCIILGCAGAGKTWLKYIMLESGIPDWLKKMRNSTPCLAKPTRIDLQEEKLAQFHFDGNRWKEIDSIGLRNFIADIMASFKKEEFETPSASEQERSQSYVGMTSTNGASIATPNTVNNSVQPTVLPPLIIKAISDVKQKIRTLLQEKQAEKVAVINRVKWLYLTDSGGQPRFIDILPFFVHTLSGAIYVMRLCDKLDDKIPVEYYKNGICIGTQSSQATALETLKYLIQMIKSRPACRDIVPTIIIVGTHADLQCEESPQEKNIAIKELFYDCKAAEMMENRYNVVHVINNLEPDEVSIDAIRMSVENLRTSERQAFPVWWYVFELCLQEVALELKTKVLSLLQCEELGSQLGFDKDEVMECLKFLHEHNVIYYDPEILENVIFVDPRVPLNIVSTLVEICYLLSQDEAKDPKKIQSLIKEVHCDIEIKATDPKWKDFTTRGIVTNEILQEIKSYYNEDVFTCDELCKLLNEHHLLVRLSKNKYFMFCLLEHLSPDDLKKYQQSMSSSVAPPLLLCFKNGLPHPGIFCWLVVFLIQKDWKIAAAITDGKDDPVMLKRNCITLIADTSPPCNVTLINSITFIEIHVAFGKKLSTTDCASALPDILRQVECGVKESSESLHYGDTELEYGFIHHPQPFFQHYLRTEFWKSSVKSHIMKVCKEKEYLECGQGSKCSPRKIKSKYSVWWTGKAPAQCQGLLSNVLLSFGIMVLIAALLGYIFAPSTEKGELNMEPQQTLDNNLSGFCTIIQSPKDLEDVLEDIRVSSYEVMCNYLNIEQCTHLANSKNLDPFTIAQKYIQQNFKACWENIIIHLCNDFKDKRLASEVATLHNITLTEYCD